MSFCSQVVVQVLPLKYCAHILAKKIRRGGNTISFNCHFKSRNKVAIYKCQRPLGEQTLPRLVRQYQIVKNVIIIGVIVFTCLKCFLNKKNHEDKYRFYEVRVNAV